MIVEGQTCRKPIAQASISPHRCRHDDLLAEVRRLQEENATYLKTIDALNGMIEQMRATEESLRYCLNQSEVSVSRFPISL